MSAAISPEQAESAYDRILDRVEARAETAEGGGYIERLKTAADEHVEAVGKREDFLTSVLTMSDRGPHESWNTSHDFDTDDPDGALRALAASAIVSDVLARG